MVWIDFGGGLCWKLLSTDKMKPEHLTTEVVKIYVVWVRLKDAYPYEWGCVSPGGNAE